MTIAEVPAGLEDPKVDEWGFDNHQQRPSRLFYNRVWPAKMTTLGVPVIDFDKEPWDNVQQTFDLVVDHLREQNEKCVAAYGTTKCVYRGAPSGDLLACAAGCLIPDKYYRSWMEGAGLTYVDRRGKKPDSVRLEVMTQRKIKASTDLDMIAYGLRELLLEFVHWAHYPSAAGLLLQKLGHNLALVVALQHVHDFYDVACWEDGFRAVAWTFKITYTPPKEQNVELSKQS